MATSRKRSPEDLLTAQDIRDEYGFNATVCESLMRYFGKHGLLETLPQPSADVPAFRRDFVRRKYVEPQRVQSGGTTCE